MCVPASRASALARDRRARRTSGRGRRASPSRGPGDVLGATSSTNRWRSSTSSTVPANGASATSHPHDPSVPPTPTRVVAGEHPVGVGDGARLDGERDPVGRPPRRAPSVADSSSSSPVWAAWIGTAHWKMASRTSMSSGIVERTSRSPVRCWWALIRPGITRWPAPPSRSASGACASRSPAEPTATMRSPSTSTPPSAIIRRSGSIVRTTSPVTSSTGEWYDRLTKEPRPHRRSPRTRSAHIMTTLTDNSHLADQWHVVCEGADLADGPVGVTLLGRDYVVWRAPDGDVVAAPDRCPHRESPLSLGHVEDGCLVCPYHGWTFGDGGRCVAVPSAQPGVPVPPKAHLAAVARRRALRPRVAVPRRAGGGDPGDRGRTTTRPIAASTRASRCGRTSATRMTDNFLDISHFPYVHTGTFGIAANTAGAEVRDRARSTTTSPATSTRSRWPTTLGKSRRRGSTAEVIKRRMTTGFDLPFTVRSTIHYETGLDHIILLCTTPIDDVTSLLHVRDLAQRRLLGAGRGGHRLRPGDRRRGQADARAGPGRAAARRARRRSACRPTRRRSSGAAAWPDHCRTERSIRVLRAGGPGRNRLDDSETLG